MLKCLHPPQENNRNDRSDKEAVFEILPPKMGCERGGARAPSYFYSDLIYLWKNSIEKSATVTVPFVVAKILQGGFFNWDPPKNHKFFSVSEMFPTFELVPP